MLEAAAAAARAGEPRLVLVEGEAGAGKSTLLARFAAGLVGAVVLRAGGDEAELLLPYGIVGQLVASARGTGRMSYAPMPYALVENLAGCAVALVPWSPACALPSSRGRGPVPGRRAGAGSGALLSFPTGARPHLR